MEMDCVLCEVRTEFVCMYYFDEIWLQLCCLRRLITVVSLWRTRSDNRTVFVRFVLKWHWVRVSSEQFCCTLSAPFYRHSTFIFIYVHAAFTIRKVGLARNLENSERRVVAWWGEERRGGYFHVTFQLWELNLTVRSYAIHLRRRSCLYRKAHHVALFTNIFCFLFLFLLRFPSFI
jgi:hypothetical protein